MRWSASGHSVIGSTHIRKEMPNQDAFAYKDLEGDVQVLALSDGHGGAAHTYSDLGSKYAVEALMDVVSNYVKGLPNGVSENKLRFDFEDYLSKEIQNTWLTKIKLDPRYESPYQYGCTLLAVVKLDHYLVCLQLGDGKIAIVYDDGVVYYPMPRDTRFENNETASLSQPNAWAELKVVVVPLEANIHMCALASDGVENAYPEDYYDDVHFFVRLAMGVETEALLSALVESAAKYSKDDTTVVLWKNTSCEMCERLPSEDLVIWMGDYPKPWQPMAILTEGTLNQKIDHAILLANTLKSYEWTVPADLTLKQIYYDPDSKQVTILESDQQQILSTGQVCAMLSDLIGLEFTSPSKELIKRDLIALKKQLRYDYENLCFVLDKREVVPSSVNLVGSNGPFEVFYNSVVFLHQLIPLVGDTDAIVGEVIQHEKHKGVWGLVNLTDHTWTVYGSNQTKIPPNRTLTIRSECTVYIYGLPVKFNINNGKLVI